MGARGTLKLPSHLRPVNDTTKAGTLAETVTKAAPEKPEGLTDDEVSLWDELVGALDGAGLLAKSDGPALHLAIRHYLAALRASDELLAGPAAVVDPHHDDRLAKNPASQVFRDHSTAFLEFAKQLGMTFVSRARTVAPKEASGSGSNPFAQDATGS